MNINSNCVPTNEWYLDVGQTEYCSVVHYSVHKGCIIMHLQLQLTQLTGEIFTITCTAITPPLSLETEFRLINGISCGKLQIAIEANHRSVHFTSFKRRQNLTSDFI